MVVIRLNVPTLPCMAGGQHAAWAILLLFTHPAFGDAVIQFAPTDVGSTSRVPVTLQNPGTGAQTITPSVLGPFSVDAAPITLVPGESRSLEVRFRPTTTGPAQGSLKLVSDVREQTFALRGEGQVRAARECIPSPCHTARWDTATGTCVEEIDPAFVPCRTLCVDDGMCVDGVCLGESRNCSDGNACTLDSCDPFRGCLAEPLPEASPCGVATCSDEPVCRGGQCVREPLAEDDADPRVCGMSLATVERPADPRRAAARLFVPASGEVHLVGDGFFERRTASGWVDASALLSGHAFTSFTPAGNSGHYWTTTSAEEIHRFGPESPPALVCEHPDGRQISAVEGTEDVVWVQDEAKLMRCSRGSVTKAGGGDTSLAKFSVCDDEQVWTNSFDAETSGGGRWRALGDKHTMGYCAGNTYIALYGNRLLIWSPQGWIQYGPDLEGSDFEYTALAEDMRGVPQDLWLRNGYGWLHWDGRRFTRLEEDVREWISPHDGEAWVLEHDGTVVHRRRP